MKIILPPRLTKNKFIGIIAPAAPVAGILPDEFVEKSYDYFQEKGYFVLVGKSVKKVLKEVIIQLHFELTIFMSL